VAVSSVLKGTVVNREAEVVIVGVGISGGALATVLGRCLATLKIRAAFIRILTG
jgi:hypothetical protein